MRWWWTKRSGTKHNFHSTNRSHLFSCFCDTYLAFCLFIFALYNPHRLFAFTETLNPNPRCPPARGEYVLYVHRLIHLLHILYGPRVFKTYYKLISYTGCVRMASANGSFSKQVLRRRDDDAQFPKQIIGLFFDYNDIGSGVEWEGGGGGLEGIRPSVSPTSANIKYIFSREIGKIHCGKGVSLSSIESNTKDVIDYFRLGSK